MNAIKMHGVGFNPEAFTKMSREAFIGHPAHQSFWPELSDDQRKARLDAAWELLVGSTLPIKIKADDIVGDGAAADKPEH